MGLKSRKEISFVGGYFEDIVLYLIRIAKCLNKKTIVVDHTTAHRFYPLVPHIRGVEPVDKVMDYRGVGYTFGSCSEKEKSRDMNEADCIFRLYDISGYQGENDPCILVTDESKRNIDIMETLSLKKESMIIIREYTGAVSKRIETIADSFNCNRVFALPVNIKDRKNAVMAEHNDMYCFTSVSKEMEKLLYEIAAFIFPEEMTKAS